ncbi:MAG TPA: hypothetical protein PK024_04245 [Methanospirillum sp.]|mgnify:FL=1|uniref:hypothetical protein n=1 Tax=Methanospirillum sp. TaxID=45200 RepID=UPI002CBF5035|nr:hypothetical protein [Methanospirillum sp.]HOJ96034.1 hypothetical protein [Methanospirillum sp.]
MRSNKKGLLLLILFIIIACVLPVQAVPPLPAEYYGNVLIDGVPAPVGTTITAFLAGSPRGTIVTDVEGFYGGPGLFDPRLKVNVSEDEYQTGNLIITFTINNMPASQSVLFEPGASQQLDLFTGEQTGNVASPALTPVPVQTEYPINTSEQDDPDTNPSDSDSTPPSIQYGLEKEEKFTSDDGMASISFNKNTLLFSPSGQFLEEVNVTSRSLADLAPVSINQSLMFSGYAYEITPERTYFNPEGIFSIQIPLERISDLMALNPQIYRYVPQTATWELVKTTSNQFTGVVSGKIYEAAIYALFLESQTAFATPNATQTTIPPSFPPVAGQPPRAQPPSPPAGLVPPSASGETPVLPQGSYQAAVETQPPLITEIPSQPPTPPELIRTPIPDTPPQVTDMPKPEETYTEEPAPAASPFSLIGSVAESMKSALKGPVGITIGLVLLIIIINALVYLIYTRWWLIRNP